MAGLLDFAQAASNSAAGNVAGPIDMLAWGLRKMGLPIPNDPVLGTEWMKQKGLIKEVPQSPASLAGETLGLLSPIVAAAKAPQIAGGLLQMGDNLTTAKTLGSGPGGGQKGAIVYHGSPHKFDKFDSSKIGTGEGAQAYGHGLYLAESPNVAKTYQNLDPTVLTPPVRAFRGMELTPGTPEYHASTLLDGMGLQQARKTVAGWISNADPRMAREVEGWAKTLETLNSATSKSDFKRITNAGGNLYKVDLPDEHIARMLDWDKPLSQQAAGVTEALSEAAKKQNPRMAEYWRASVGLDDAAKNELRKRMGINVFDAIDAGGAAYQSLGQKSVEELLRQQGIPGIRYLDGGSRAAGQGTANYVIFPGNEGLLTILERNGVPLR